MQSKVCPRSAFLGLYGGKGKNALYATKALEYLKANPNKDISIIELWEIIMEGEKKAHNQQMDVVITLFKEGLI